MPCSKLAFSAALLAASLLLSACARPTPDKEPRVQFETVLVPVATGCIAEGGRPTEVKPLKEQMSREQWGALAPGAKASSVQAQVGDRLNYEDALEAATSGCK